MTKPISCFKAYDIRGQLGTELNTDVAYRVGRAFGEILKAETVVVGGDARATSEELKLAVADGLMDAGVKVIDIGMVGTEEIYFATSHLNCSGGIEVTASHNPMDYNGMKFVSEDSKPISGDSGLKDIQKVAEEENWTYTGPKGSYETKDILADYVTHLMGYINAPAIKPLKLVVNSGNGAAGHVVDEIERQFAAAKIPVDFVKVHHDPDHTFPNGIPNPLLPENRAATADAVKAHGADMGIAWDGDFDRCFLFDEKGDFVDGYYIVGLLAEAFMQKQAGAKVIYDPRTYWNTQDIAESNGGTAIMSKCGHSFIKETMRKEDAAYGGEMSAHHYFRDFFYCDSGMIPWLLVIELLSVKNIPLSAMLNDRIAKFPSSGEINFRVTDADTVISRIENHDYGEPYQMNRIDGIDMIFADWRLNLRKSNTEPVIRLNMESRGQPELVEEKLDLLKQLING